MKNFIESLQLRKSDLFLALGFIPLVVFFIFGQLFMQFQNPNDVALPLWAAIVCLVALLGLWGYYLYLEVYLKNDKFQNYVFFAMVFILLLNIIVILVQPSASTENVIIRYREFEPELVGTVTQANLVVTGTHKLIFISELIGSGLLIYIGLFIFPKRFTSLAFLKYLGYALFIMLFILIIYGYIAQFDRYVAFFKHILGTDRTDPDIYHKTVYSFILHRNAYGMMMMVGIIFCCINHSIEHKWWYYLLAVFFYINMIFSLCKSGLIISAITFLVYVIYRLIVTFKEHKKRNTIILVCGGGLALLIVGLAGLSVLTKGKVLSFVYNAYESLFRGGESYDFRLFIWDNTYQLLQNGWWLIGRGFGSLNLMLEPMNIASHSEKVFPTHSAYLGLLAEGGIIYLIAYIVLLGYACYVAYKCFKKNPGLTLTMCLGIVSFVLYSFIETIHYFVYVFLFPLMILYQVTYKQEPKQIEKE